MLQRKFSSRLSNTVVVVLWGWLLAGLSLLLSPIFDIHDVNPALALAEDWAKVIISILLVIGCACVLMAGRSWTNSSTSWKFELVGLPLLISGWGFYTTAILLINGLTLFPIVLGLSHGFAAIARFETLLFEKRQARAQVATLAEELPHVE